MVNFKITALIISEKADYYKTLNANIVHSKIYKKDQEVNLIFKTSIQTQNELFEILYNNKTIDAIIVDKFTDNNTLDIIDKLSVEFKNIVYQVDEFNENTINSYIIKEVFKEKTNDKLLFSFYTCTFNTDFEMLSKLYNSMCNQTYTSWNWYILDDSTNSDVEEYIKSFRDPRITVYKNVTNHANIGFNKHSIAMLCNGDWLLEVDHDDYLTSDCLQTIYDAITKFPKSKFIYSNTFENYGDIKYPYGKEYMFSWCLGYYKNEIVEGEEKTIATTGALNPVTLRTILCAPNHIRCVEKDFYHKIGGHNTRLSILDDLDLVNRIFLNCTSCEEITYIDKCLYIQNLKDEHVTQNTNNNVFVYDETIFYNNNKKIHDKLLELNLDDPFWNDKAQESSACVSYIRRYRDRLQKICNVYNPNE